MEEQQRRLGERKEALRGEDAREKGRGLEERSGRLVGPVPCHVHPVNERAADEARRRERREDLSHSGEHGRGRDGHGGSNGRVDVQVGVAEDAEDLERGEEVEAAEAQGQGLGGLRLEVLGLVRLGADVAKDVGDAGGEKVDVVQHGTRGLADGHHGKAEDGGCERSGSDAALERVVGKGDRGHPGEDLKGGAEWVL